MISLTQWIISTRLRTCTHYAHLNQSPTTLPFFDTTTWPNWSYSV